MRWLLRWQHVAPGTQLNGERGLLEAIGSCRALRFPPAPGSGRFCPGASAITTPAALDRLCLTGAVGWGVLSPHPATWTMPVNDPAFARRRPDRRRRPGQPRSPRRADFGGSDHAFPARRMRLDAVASTKSDSELGARGLSAPAARSACNSCASAAHRSSPTSCAAPAS